MTEIRAFEASDWPAVWSILEPIFRAGDTYVFSPAIGESEARAVWVDAPDATYVATAGGVIVGTYYVKPNQPGLGSHVCNCGYVVAAHARGRGVASALCEHSQQEGLRLGFRAMQFNLVVSTNVGAVRLWERLGFVIVGRIPGAFNHAKHGYVDAFVMFKQLL